MPGLFGQEELISSLVCPNAGAIRTGRANFYLVLSEYRAYSDRRGEFLPLRVRMRGLFGQEGLISSLSCPNCGVIWTGRADFFLCVFECWAYLERKGGFLPRVVRNAGLIRTGGADFYLKLSECISHSD